MSLERMFEDLEGRMAHLEAQEMRHGAEELARTERAQIALPDRLRAAVGVRLAVHLGADHVVEGPLIEVGADWMLLGEDALSGPRAIVPMHAPQMIVGLPARARAPESELLPPRSLGSLLREVADERAAVVVHTDAGTRTGRICGVGRDALDLACEAAGPRRGARQQGGGGAERVTIPWGALRVLAVAG